MLIRAVVWMVAVAILILLAPPVLAQGEYLTVSVDCEGSPKTVRVTNGTGTAIEVAGLRYENPVALGVRWPRSDSLAAGQSITYYAGPDAPKDDPGTFYTEMEFFREAVDGIAVYVKWGDLEEEEEAVLVTCIEQRERFRFITAPTGQRALITADQGVIIVTLDCDGTPERIVVTNASSAPLPVAALLVHPENEKTQLLRRRDSVEPGQSIVYYAGPAAPVDDPNTIYTDSELFSTKRHSVDVLYGTGGIKRLSGPSVPCSTRFGTAEVAGTTLLEEALIGLPNTGGGGVAGEQAGYQAAATVALVLGLGHVPQRPCRRW